MSILGYTFEDYRETVKKFHGAEAPGVLIGGFMVALAVRNLPEDILYDAICETRACLPDAIQILTPCTIGNGWLKVVHLGLFAVTLYGKHNYEGVRVFLDVGKVEPWQEIKAWFFKLKPKKEQNRERIIGEITKAGENILSVQPIIVKPGVAEKKHKGQIGVCPECREAYPLDDGPACLLCQGNSPYVKKPRMYE